MPMPAIKPAEPFELRLPDAEPTPSVVPIDGTAAAWVESPARLLHDRLVQSFTAPQSAEPQLLPAPARLAILAGSSVVLWSAVYGIAKLIG